MSEVSPTRLPGGQHRREAERLVGLAHDFTYGDGADPVSGAALAAEALVHAVLALVDVQVQPPAPEVTAPAEEVVLRPAAALALFLDQHPEVDGLPLKYEIDGERIQAVGKFHDPRTPEIAEVLAAALEVERHRYENRHKPEKPFVVHSVYGVVSGVDINFVGYADMPESASGGQPAAVDGAA